MAVTPSTYYMEGVNNTKIAVTRDGLRAIFGQVEAELHRSEVYQHAMESLCQGLGEAAAKAYQMLIQTVGREAIRLALRQLLRQYRTLSPQPVEVSGHPPVSVSTEFKVMTSAAVPSSTDEMTPATPKTVAPAEPTIASAFKSKPQEPATPAKNRAVKSEFTPSLAKGRSSLRSYSANPTEEQRHRQVVFGQLAETIRQAREARGLSIEQLHYKTWVPIHQLKSLEMGDIERLPEDIYVRGFLRRIANVLKLDAEQVIASLNGFETRQTVIPSWQHSVPSSRQLQPVHLYLGYAALMAGAVGGLAWMSQQPMSTQLLNYQFPDFLPKPLSHASQDREFTVTPGSQADTGGAIANPEMNPPEALPF